VAPTIQTADTKNGTVTTNSNAWTITYPTNIAAGDLLLLFAGIDGSTSWNANAAGFTTLKSQPDGNAAVTHVLCAKIAVGGETGTFTLSGGATEQGGWRIFRITDWFGSGLPAGGVGQQDGNGLSVAADPPTGTSANPNPPNLDPANWGTEDTLWFATCAVDTSRTISVYPLAGNNSADVSGGSGGATLGICTTTSAVASLDPGTFTVSAADDRVTFTVAVRPVFVPIPDVHMALRTV
jgi:hypothetical protein